MVSVGDNEGMSDLRSKGSMKCWDEGCNRLCSNGVEETLTFMDWILLTFLRAVLS